MRQYFSLLLLVALSFQAYSQAGVAGSSMEEALIGVNHGEEISIIPAPVSVIKGEGHFVLPENVTIQSPASAELKQAVAFLQERLSIPTGSYVSNVNAPTATATIKLILNDRVNPALGKEGYELSITPNFITIKANKAAGIFYGIQSLIQLFPVEIESKEPAENIEWTAPCVEITDYPRVGWRGLMFDVARHFPKLK